MQGVKKVHKEEVPTHFYDKLTIKAFVFIRKVLKDEKLRKIVEPSVREFVDTMLSNSVYGIKTIGDNQILLRETILSWKKHKLKIQMVVILLLKK